jgi:asparagine synthase (glutamine-hydrolysing)
MVPAEPDLRGIDHIFTFSALPGPITCFKGVQLLQAGHYLMVRPGGKSGTTPSITDRAYWEMDFPDRGEEERGENAKSLVDRFEHLLVNAVEERLRADVPVGSYLSGGVDSSVIAALACHVKGPAINTYTVRVDAPDLDELDAANLVARYIGTKPPIVQNFRTEDALNTYPRLIHAAEAPVLDTSCAALLQLARRVHSCDQKVVLTGEGADEWLIGYPWYKAEKILNFLDVIPRFPLSDWFRRGYLRLHNVPQYSARYRRAVEVSLGGPNAWIDAYGLLAISKLRFYAPALRDVLLNHNAWADLQIPLDRAKRWHPLNRGIWVAARVTLAGHLLQAKGDRVAMNSSVEVRYPFLDEEVFSFLASLDPRWKLRGFRDKHLLRLLAKRWVPPSVYHRQKVIFRAPLDSFHIEPEPPFVGQLMSEESLRRSGYFNVEQVRHWRHAFRQLRPGSLERLSVELGLVGVVATQLWHHLFIDPELAEIPSLTANGEIAEKAPLRSG